MKRIKNFFIGVALLLLVLVIDNQLKGKMPPNEWTRRCIVALIGAALILLLNVFLSWRFP